MIDVQVHAYIELAHHAKQAKKAKQHYQKIIIFLDIHDNLKFKENNQIVIDNISKSQTKVIMSFIQNIQKQFNIEKGVHLSVEKQDMFSLEEQYISAVIKGLSSIWALNLTIEEQEEILFEYGYDMVAAFYEMPSYISSHQQVLFLDVMPIQSVLLFKHPYETTERIKATVHKTKRFDQLIRLYMNQQYQLFFKHTKHTLFEAHLKQNKPLLRLYKQLKKQYKRELVLGNDQIMYVATLGKNELNMNHKLAKMTISFAKTHLKT